MKRKPRALRSNPKADCLRQCIAYLLGLRSETVPDFVNLYPRRGLMSQAGWFRAMCRWLRGRGVWVFCGRRNRLYAVHDAPHIAVCRSKGKQLRHAVVESCGNGPYWDCSNFDRKTMTVMERIWLVRGPLPPAPTSRRQPKRRRRKHP